jgi:hypothetical protein
VLERVGWSAAEGACRPTADPMPLTIPVSSAADPPLVPNPEPATALLLATGFAQAAGARTVRRLSRRGTEMLG